jgi:hypothetical protein
MENKIIDSVKAAGGFVKYAEKQAKEVSDTIRERVEQSDLSAETEIVKRKARKLVHKVSKKSYSVFENHKDILPEKLKPVSETVELILESVVELSKNDDEEEAAEVVTDAKANEQEAPKKRRYVRKAKAAQAEAPKKRRYVRKAKVTKESAPAEAPAEAPAAE